MIELRTRLVSGPERFVWIERHRDRIREVIAALLAACRCEDERVEYHLRRAWWWGRRLSMPRIVEHECREWSDD